jgi:antitoxin component YwqK of YwqJK toxin-antitoxin module
MEKHIVRTHRNGSPHVVMYTVGNEHERVKEELYFPNGQLDYVGHYKNGVEHGEWIYYYPTGKLKSYESYIRGLEEGIHYDLDSAGTRVKEIHYHKGVLLREVDFSSRSEN